MPKRQKPVAKKHKFVKDGIFFAELNGFLGKELAKDGYGGCEVRVTPTRTEVIIRATKTTAVVGPKGRRIQELTSLVQKRFNFEKGKIVLFAQMVKNRGLSALAQAEAVRYRLFEGLSVRRAAYSVLKFIMERGAQGCEVIVSGKLRGQRAKSMKFRDGWMIHAGEATNQYIDEAVKHVHLRQGVIGIKVRIMLPHDPDGTSGGPTKEIPDKIKVKEPKDVDPLLFAQEEFAQQQQRAYQPYQRYQQAPSAQQVQGGQFDQAPPEAAGFGAPQRPYEQQAPPEQFDQMPPSGAPQEQYPEDVEQAPYEEQFQPAPQYGQEYQQPFSQYDPNAPY